MIIKKLKGKKYGQIAFCRCDSCNNEFKRSVSNLKENQFCSKSCYFKWLKDVRTGKKHDATTKETLSKKKMGKLNPQWKGGKVYTEKGYVYIYSPEHPNNVKEGYVLEHRLVMEKELGRYLTGDELVHHINGIRDDNRPENLEVLSFGEHIKRTQNERHQRDK